MDKPVGVLGFLGGKIDGGVEILYFGRDPGGVIGGVKKGKGAYPTAALNEGTPCFLQAVADGGDDSQPRDNNTAVLLHRTN